MLTLSEQQKSVLAMTGGAVLLLYTIGILQNIFYYFLIAGSLFLFAYGFYRGGYANQILKLIKKKK